jgi:hypothetical protein
MALDSSELCFQVREACADIMAALRPDAVALVDAFDIPDNVLNSTIGRKDGNVYEAIFNAAPKSELNQQDPFIGWGERGVVGVYACGCGER